jgi:ankyrin repeat protein
MAGPPSPPQSTEPHSLRWDAAQRACRDNDLATLKLLITQGGLFENIPALRSACISGAWGRGTRSSSPQIFSTTDSIRLSKLLQTATTRGHTDIIQYLLKTFPAKDLHVLEWEIVVNALATGRVEVLEPFLEVDPELVGMCDEKRFGTCFTVLFDLVEKEKHLPVVETLCEHSEDVATLSNVFQDCARASSAEVLAYLEKRAPSPVSHEMLLCIASSHGNEDISRFLLHRGADINTKARTGTAETAG